MGDCFRGGCRLMSRAPFLPGTTRRIIDADARQEEAAEIKPRACCPVIVADEIVPQGGSHAAD